MKDSGMETNQTLRCRRHVAKKISHDIKIFRLALGFKWKCVGCTLMFDRDV